MQDGVNVVPLSGNALITNCTYSVRVCKMVPCTSKMIRPGQSSVLMLAHIVICY